MLENAWYSVISGDVLRSYGKTPRAEDAAAVLRLTASDLLRLGVIDEVLSEPSEELIVTRLQLPPP